MRIRLLFAWLFFTALAFGLTLASWAETRTAGQRAAAAPVSSDPGQELLRAGLLRQDARASLPPDAVEVEVVSEQFPVGWLTFVRVVGGVRTKYLVCYQRGSFGHVSLSVTRAE